VGKKCKLKCKLAIPCVAQIVEFVYQLNSFVVEIVVFIFRVVLVVDSTKIHRPFYSDVTSIGECCIYGVDLTIEWKLG
jgi:hypothetical protein